MALLINCWLLKPEGVSSDPQQWPRRAGLSVCICNPGATGERTPAACWPASLAELVRFGFSGRFVPESQVESNEGRYQMLTSGFHLHMYLHNTGSHTEESTYNTSQAYRHVCVCTCVHTHAHTDTLYVNDSLLWARCENSKQILSLSNQRPPW